jgi:hypothetical protein
MCADCNFESLLEEIEDMQGDECYEFASDTLTGIYTWVEEANHCTEDQKQAVENIRSSKE